MTEDASGQGNLSRAAELIELGTLSMRSVRVGTVHTICLCGELDLATADRVSAELEAIEATDARQIIVDLSGLTFIDSSGLHLLVKADARSRADSDRLTLLRASAGVQRVFELTELEKRLPFAD